MPTGVGAGIEPPPQPPRNSETVSNKSDLNSVDIYAFLAHELRGLDSRVLAIKLHAKGTPE
jgi:hypothetical protein